MSTAQLGGRRLLQISNLPNTNPQSEVFPALVCPGLPKSPLTSSDPILPSDKGPLPSSSMAYAPSERDHDIGRVLDQSFGIPNLCDEDRMKQVESNVTKNKTHLANPLFMLLIVAHSVGAQERSIGKGERNFETSPNHIMQEG
jgi:hypothetical protein